MQRAFFVSLSKASWAQRLFTRWGVARRAAARFIAGETAVEAIQTVRQLNAAGILATLDTLGENTTSLEDASRSAEETCQLLAAIDAAGVRANVSIKLSQYGLSLDSAVCRSHLLTILEQARRAGNFVRIDMEDSTVTSVTLEHYVAALDAGFDNVGIVLQAYLYRTVADLDEVLRHGGRVRLCKGAYREPPALAFPRAAQVCENFDALAECLLRANGSPLSSVGRFPAAAALATHDPRRITAAQNAAQSLGLSKQALEFQMLFGMRRDLQEQLVAQGYPVRVYVPYGPRWFPYFMRRLGERPENLTFFISNFFRR
jgi:proline dehydrogenase